MKKKELQVEINELKKRLSILKRTLIVLVGH